MVQQQLQIEDIQRVSFKQQLSQPLCVSWDCLLPKQIDEQSFPKFEVCLKKICQKPQSSFRSSLIRTWLAEARVEKLALPKFKENVVAAAAKEKPFKKEYSLFAGEFLRLSQHVSKDVDEQQLEMLLSLLKSPIHLHSDLELRDFLLDNEAHCRLNSHWQHHAQSRTRHSCVFSDWRLSSELFSALFKQSCKCFIRLQLPYYSKCAPAHGQATVFAELKEAICNGHTTLTILSHRFFIKQVEKSEHSQKLVEEFISKQFLQVVAFTWLREDTLHELQEVVVEVQRMLAEIKAIYKFQGKRHQIAAQLSVVVYLSENRDERFPVASLESGKSLPNDLLQKSIQSEPTFTSKYGHVGLKERLRCGKVKEHAVQQSRQEDITLPIR